MAIYLSKLPSMLKTVIKITAKKITQQIRHLWRLLKILKKNIQIKKGHAAGITNYLTMERRMSEIEYKYQETNSLLAEILILLNKSGGANYYGIPVPKMVPPLGGTGK